MKNSLLKSSIQSILILLLSFAFTSYESNAQSIFQIDEPTKPHFYVSTQFVKVKHLAQSSPDEYFSSYSYYQNALKLSIGYQLKNNIAIEASYMGRDLLFASSIDNIFIATTSSSNPMHYFSLGITNKLPIIKNRLFLTPSVGYTLGKSGRSSGSIINTNLLDYGDLSVSTNTNTYSLITNKSHNFINAGLGLEANITNRIACNIGVNYIKGFKDIIRKDISYEVNGEVGDVSLVTDGSVSAFEMGIKYNFK